MRYFGFARLLARCFRHLLQLSFRAALDASLCFD